MKTLKEAHNALKNILPECLDISKTSPQGGVYLIFVGLRQLSTQIDEANFKILVQSRSYDDDNVGIFTKIDEIRAVLMQNEDKFLKDIGVAMEFEGFENSLFIYSIDVRFKIYRSKSEVNS